MSKNMMIGVSVLIVILVGYKIYTLEFQKDEVVIPEAQDVQTEQSTNLVQEDTSGTKEELVEVAVATNVNTSNNLSIEPILAPKRLGSYEAYNSSKLAYAENGDVVLFFRASWCPSCRTLDKNIKENISNIPSGVIILDVDYDNSTDLKKKYGVTYQHTLVQVDSSGNMIAKWSGGSTLQDLVSKIN